MHSCQGLRRVNRRPAALLAKASPDGELTLADDLAESVKSSLCLSCKKKYKFGEREREEPALGRKSSFIAARDLRSTLFPTATHKK